MKELRTHGDNFPPYFVLDDLWESLKEWSAYGAGVPLVLSGGDSVVQYYVPYLSAIQVYIDPSRPTMRMRKPGEESDGGSSGDGNSGDCGRCGLENGTNYVQGHWNLQNQKNAAKEFSSRLSSKNNLATGSAFGESEISNPPGLLVFEYFAHDLPYTREPLADKILKLASQFPELKTYRSCDLTPSSWLSVAWYPIYRIPVGTTLNNIDACFLTFHSLSTLYGNTCTDLLQIQGSTAKQFGNGMSLQLSLPIFGLAPYKFKVSDWSPEGEHDCQKITSLFQAADNWLRLLQVDHPDYRFFKERGKGTFSLIQLEEEGRMRTTLPLPKRE
ncbi:uncharacterized protein LOC141687501 isoform X2 [Apium graveolens]